MTPQIMAKMVKTAAILHDMTQSAEPFRSYALPEVTACATQ
jgi:hypothetical protein